MAERMAWAARRTTSRAEDMAYCLMGIFNVNMPLLYGEGGEKASIRLQEEILKDSEDQSIFAWDTSSKGDDIRQIGALTTSPSLFHSGGAMEAIPTFESQIALTSKGAHASFPIMTLDGGRKVALLACRFETDMDSIVGIPVQHELGGTMPSSPAFYSSGGTNITPTPFPITTAPYMVSRSASNMQVYSRQRRAPGLVTISLTAPRRLSQAVCLLKRDQPIGTPNRRRLKCWLCYGTLSAVFGPMEDRWYTLGWNISPGGMMTRLFARQRKSIAVPFVQHLQPENRLSFCIVLDIRPGRVHVDEGDVDIVHVGLAALYEEASAGYSLDEQMEHVLARVDGIAIADEAQLVDASTGSIIRASIATIEDGSIFQINLSREKPRSV